jgi:hypothetical protein
MVVQDHRPRAQVVGAQEKEVVSPAHGDHAPAQHVALDDRRPAGFDGTLRLRAPALLLPHQLADDRLVYLARRRPLDGNRRLVVHFRARRAGVPAEARRAGLDLPLRLRLGEKVLRRRPGRLPCFVRNDILPGNASGRGASWSNGYMPRTWLMRQRSNQLTSVFTSGLRSDLPSDVPIVMFIQSTHVFICRVQRRV